MALEDKYNRVLQTKAELKEVLNEYGGDITDETVFREYPVIAQQLLESGGGGGGVFIREANFKFLENVVLDKVKINNIKNTEGKFENHIKFLKNIVFTYPLIENVIYIKGNKTILKNAVSLNEIEKFSTKQKFKVSDKINASILLYKYYKLSDLNKKVSEYASLTLSEMNFRKI